MPILLANRYTKNISEKLGILIGVKGLLNQLISQEQMLRKVLQVLDKKMREKPGCLFMCNLFGRKHECENTDC